jgi:hypothetical protein
VVDVAEPALPATVVTAHLAACAAALDGSVAGLPLDELPLAAEQLVAGQRDIATALAALAARLDRGPLTEERAALVEVLRAAASATGHAAQALDAGGQLFESVAKETRF